MQKYIIQTSPLSGHIYVGERNKHETSFAGKSEATDMALAAVAQYVAINFDGSMEATFPGLDGGVRLTVKVEPL